MVVGRNGCCYGCECGGYLASSMLPNCKVAEELTRSSPWSGRPVVVFVVKVVVAVKVVAVNGGCYGRKGSSGKLVVFVAVSGSSLGRKGW